MENKFIFEFDENDEIVIKKTGSIIEGLTFLFFISGRYRYCIDVICGKCKKKRPVPIANIGKNFTGLCRNCFSKSSWKIKRGYTTKPPYIKHLESILKKHTNNLELIPNNATHNLITKLQTYFKHLEPILKKHNIKS